MKNRVLVAGMFALAACSGGESAISAAPMQNPTDDQAVVLEAQLTALAEGFPGLSITVLKGDDTAFVKNYGVADLETGEPVTADTRFNIYSVSKLVTGFAFLRLTHRDEVPLDASIGQVSPNLPPAYSSITLRQLLTHTSGIRHYKGREDWIDFSRLACASPLDAIAYFRDDPLMFEPGASKLYSTFGMVVASQALIDLTGAGSFDTALTSALSFNPRLQLDEVAAQKATPYVKISGEYVSMRPSSAECKFGGGGLLASSKTLAEFGRSIYDGRIVPAPQLHEALVNGADKADANYAYGMGFGLTETAAGEEVLYVTAGGGAAGGRGYLIVVVDSQIAVSITGNAEGDSEAVAQAALALTRHYLNTK